MAETVAAAVVIQADASIDEQGVRTWCQEMMSPYKIPRRWLLTDRLPRNAMGKVTKPEVVSRFASSTQQGL